jgi:fructokinase
VTAEGTVAVPAVSVPVVDTVGAGDTFMAALADRLLERGAAGGALRAPGGGIRLDDLEHDLRRCVQAAAITVSRPGADPPRLAELRAAVG